MRYPLLLAAIMMALSGCSKKSNPVGPALPPPAPSFTITAQPVTLSDGSAGLTFFARCTTDDINLIKVVVGFPDGTSQTYNAGDAAIVENQNFGCQDQGYGYPKLLGTWSFTFVGNKAAGDKSSFNVTTTLNVTG